MPSTTVDGGQRFLAHTGRSVSSSTAVAVDRHKLACTTTVFRRIAESNGRFNAATDVPILGSTADANVTTAVSRPTTLFDAVDQPGSRTRPWSWTTVRRQKHLQLSFSKLAVQQITVEHQHGHWSYGCPSVNQLPTTTTNQYQATVNGVSDSNSSTHTYLSVVINGIKTSCLLDSGSEKNLLPKRLISDAD